MFWREIINKIIIFYDLELFGHILTSNGMTYFFNLSISGALGRFEIRILFLKRFCRMLSMSSYLLSVISATSILPCILGVVEFISPSFRIKKCLGLYHLFLLLMSCGSFCIFHRLVLHFDRSSFHIFSECQLLLTFLITHILLFSSISILLFSPISHILLFSPISHILLCPPIRFIEPFLYTLRWLILYIDIRRWRPIIKSTYRT
jgi:hypothetical protein